MKITMDIRQCDNLELMVEILDNTIDLIYCDILYGTGKKYKEYKDLKPEYKIIEKHYIPRIKEMYRILKNTGSIYLQMDWRINHWIRCIMDDVFGYDRFLNEIVWLYGAGGGDSKFFRRTHDNILLYSKTDSYTFNKQKNCYGSNLQDWWNIKGIQDKSGIFQIDDEYHIYSTQKPKALLERIIKASSNEDDLVADFYMGSGTTAEVCFDLNRNFIGCDINEKAIKISKRRHEIIIKQKKNGLQAFF